MTEIKNQEESLQFKEEDGWQICFINTHKQPNEIIRLPQFQYSTINGEDSFFQLCTYKYLYRESIWYSIYVWEEIKVPTYKIPLFKLTCDSMKGLT